MASGPQSVVLTIALITVATLVPIVKGTQGDYLRSLYDTYALPEDLFTEKLELVHGRLAMLGECSAAPLFSGVCIVSKQQMRGGLLQHLNDAGSLHHHTLRTVVNVCTLCAVLMGGPSMQPTGLDINEAKNVAQLGGMPGHKCHSGLLPLLLFQSASSSCTLARLYDAVGRGYHPNSACARPRHACHEQTHR